MNKNLTAILTVAVLIEGMITYFGTFIVCSEMPWELFMSLAIATTITLLYDIDLLEYLGLTSKVPFVGAILTGIILSRGSNYVYEIITAISNLKY